MGIKPTSLTEFYRSLRARGMTTDLLAEEIGRSGGAVRRVIGGLRRRAPWWSRFEALLTERERELLGDVEQCPTWNKPREAKRPRWNAEKALILQGYVELRKSGTAKSYDYDPASEPDMAAYE
jgi:hypothetical protein